MGNGSSSSGSSSGSREAIANKAGAGAGGAESKQLWNTDSVKLKEEYGWWTLPAVAGAFERAMELNSRYLTRNQFWQVFTDYTVLTMREPRTPPTFLSLNLTVFKLFATTSPLRADEVYLVPPPSVAAMKATAAAERAKAAEADAAAEGSQASDTPRSAASGGKPGRLARGASSRALSRQGSSRSLKRQGSSRSLKRQGSSRSLKRQGSRRSLKRQGSTVRQPPVPAVPETKADEEGEDGGTDTRRGSRASKGKVATVNAAASTGRLQGVLKKKFAQAAKRVMTINKTLAALPRVDVLEILLVLALFCQGETGRKLTFMFSVFDVDTSGALSKDEMHSFLQTLCAASVRIGVLERHPRPDHIRSLTEKMFEKADNDRSGTITCTEFVAWAQVHILARGILSAYDQVRRETEKSKKGATMSITRDSAPTEKVSALQRVRALNKVMLATKAMMAKFKSSKQEFTVDSLRAMRTTFNELARTNLAHPTELTKAQFVNLMHEEYPFLVEQRPTQGGKREEDSDDDDDVVTHLFAAFDADRSGTISFKELVLGLSKHMAGGFGEKVKLMFEAFSTGDNDGDGSIQVKELLDLVKSSKEEFTDVISFTENTIAALDKDESGTLSVEEFTDAIKTKPVLFQCVVQSGAQPQQLTNFKDAVMNESVKFRDVFTMSRLREAWDRATRDELGFHVDRLSITAFRQFMVNEFQCPQGLLPACNRMFDALDTNHDGYLSKKELFTGLAKIMDGEREEKAKFVFTMFDADGSGEMDLGEVMAMVISTQENVSQTTAAASHLLRKLDINGDGSVDFNEFQEACRKEPQLLECFSQMFGTTAMEDRSSATRAKRVASRLMRAVAKRSNKYTGVSKTAAEDEGAKTMRKLSLFTAGRVVTHMVSQLRATQDNARKAASEATSPKAGISAEAAELGAAARAAGSPPSSPPARAPLSPQRNAGAPVASQSQPQWRYNRKAGDGAEERLKKAKENGVVTRAVGQAYGDFLKREVKVSRNKLASKMKQQAQEMREARKLEEEAATKAAAAKGVKARRRKLVVPFGEIARAKRLKRMLALKTKAFAAQQEHRRDIEKLHNQLEKKRSRASMAGTTDGDGGESDGGDSSDSSEAPTRHYGSSDSSGEEDTVIVTPWRRRGMKRSQTSATMVPSAVSLRRSTSMAPSPSTPQFGARGGRGSKQLLSSPSSPALHGMRRTMTSSAALSASLYSPVRFSKQRTSGTGSPLTARPRSMTRMRIMTHADQRHPTPATPGSDGSDDDSSATPAVHALPHTQSLFAGDGGSPLFMSPKARASRTPARPSGSSDRGSGSNGNDSARVVSVWDADGSGSSFGATPQARRTAAPKRSTSAASRWGDSHWQSKSALTKACSMRHKRSHKRAPGARPNAGPSRADAVRRLTRGDSVTGRAMSSAMASSFTRGGGSAAASAAGRYRFVDTQEAQKQGGQLPTVQSFFAPAATADREASDGDATEALQSELSRGFAVLDAVASANKTAAAVQQHRHGQVDAAARSKPKFVAPKASLLYL